MLIRQPQNSSRICHSIWSVCQCQYPSGWAGYVNPEIYSQSRQAVSHMNAHCLYTINQAKLVIQMPCVCQSACIWADTLCLGLAGFVSHCHSPCVIIQFSIAVQQHVCMSANMQSAGRVLADRQNSPSRTCHPAVSECQCPRPAGLEDCGRGGTPRPPHTAQSCPLHSSTQAASATATIKISTRQQY